MTLRYILTKIMAVITRHDRYMPVIEWATGNWTHNVFRTYELIFGRRVGIRREAASFIDIEAGIDLQFTFTLEATLALLEGQVRQWLKSWRFEKVKLYVPALVGYENCPAFPSPYLFAIARDSAGTTITATGLSPSITRSHTNSGSDRFLLASSEVATVSDNITDVTFNGTSFFSNNIGKPSFTLDGDARTYLYYQIAPTATTANCVFTCSTSAVFRAYTASYTGVDQSSPIDNSGTSNSNTVPSTDTTVTFTVTAANCWAHLVCANNSTTPIAGTGATWLTTGTATGYGAFDSNGTIGTGSYSMGWNIGAAAATGQGTVLVAFKPVGGAVVNSNFLMFM